MLNNRNLMRVAVPLLCLMTALAFQNCSKTQEDAANPAQQFPFSSSNLYFKTTQKFTFEVYYEPGAEPYVGTTPKGAQYWDILKDNMVSIFQFRSTAPTYSIPTMLADMSSIPTQNKTDWTTTDILSLNANYKKSNPSDTEARFYIYFLKGYFNNGTQQDQSVIGVSLSGTPIIAIFKQVVQSTGSSPTGPVPKFVEQSTLVHEMGHALGFVNNGVAMVKNYQDTAHGSHSLDPNCVMYWQNEGAASLSAFIQKYLSTTSVVMWGPDVLNDAKAASQ